MDNIIVSVLRLINYSNVKKPNVCDLFYSPIFLTETKGVFHTGPFSCWQDISHTYSKTRKKFELL